MTLRDYQRDHVSAIEAAWAAGARNVMPILPTGGGKTTCFSHLLRKLNAPACAAVHRNELVSQISLALNRDEVPHGIIAPTELVKATVTLHMETHGKSFYNPRAPIRVGGINTLAARGGKDPWFKQVKYLVMDEGHHVLRENIFGKVVSLFPGARGLFPTAHALRGDGAGLGRHSDGLVDQLVLGPSARDLIARGFLVDYRLIAPPSDVDISAVPLTANHEFSPAPLRFAVHESKTIVGDVVRTYSQFANGKLGLTFAVDVEGARELVAAYQAAGVPAEIITAETPILTRARVMRQFRARQLLQLVSVDVLGEGVDVPAVEVISMARPTASFQLYSQQFGRGLRVDVSPTAAKVWDQLTDAQRLDAIAASAKRKLIVIDHVQNWVRLGLPDAPRQYSLDRAERKARQAPKDVIPLRSCLNPECLEVYPRTLPACPYCRVAPTIGRRGSPDLVDGDLLELDPSVLRAMRGEVERIDGPPQIPHGVPPAVAGAIKRSWGDRQREQSELRRMIALWAGYQRTLGRGDAEGYKRFYFEYGTDVLSAQALGAKEALALGARIQEDLVKLNVRVDL